MACEAMAWAKSCRYGAACYTRNCRYYHPKLPCKYGVACPNRDTCKYDHRSTQPLNHKPKIKACVWNKDIELKSWIRGLNFQLVSLMILNMNKTPPGGNSWYLLDDKGTWTETTTLMGQDPNTYKDCHLLAPDGRKSGYSFINITNMFPEFKFYVYAQQNWKTGTIRLLIRRM